MIKLFSIDPLKIYENNFKNMLYSDFIHLEKIPKGVEEESVRDLTEYLQKAKSIDIPTNATVNQVLLEIELRQL